jgi:hypothetical protein
VTIIKVPPSTQLSKYWVDDLVNDWSSKDDVFRFKFLQNIIFVSPEQVPKDTRSMHDDLPSTWETIWSTTITPETDIEGLTSGPYVMWKGELCKAFRLYDDPQQAFIVATKPQLQKG